ncbi:MAG: zinc ribbon domain-containing protein [Bacteroidaceae bacterium]|nr:zinc ribbon domain-containing protein [Bacteroidaceae bacterium]
METKKEFTAMDFLTFTVAGNVVVTDPVTGKEFLCFHNPDNTFTDSRDNQQLKAEEIYALVELRIEQAHKMDAEIEARAAQEAAAQQTPPPPPAPSAPSPSGETAPPPPPPTGTASAPKFCGNCGAPLMTGGKFCTKCGTPVE